MNFSINDKFLRLYGSTLEIDGIFLFAVSPTAMIGLLLNILSIIVIYKIKTKKSSVIFKYLKIYCINSILVCLLASPSFYVYSPRFVGLKIDEWARFYKCYGGSYIAPTFYLFGNFLDIIISTDRLSIFMPKFKYFLYFNPYINCIILFFTCCIINVPTALRIYLKNDNEINDDLLSSITNSTSFSMCGAGLFSKNIIMVGLNIFLRDIVTLILEITLSILVIIKHKRFQSLKSKLKNRNNNIQNKSIKFNGNSARNSSQETKLARMTVSLSLISIMTHITIFITFICFLFPVDSVVVGYLILLGIYSITIKHALNFVIFYKFNSNFRKILMRLLKIKHNRINGKTEISINQTTIL